MTFTDWKTQQQSEKIVFINLDYPKYEDNFTDYVDITVPIENVKGTTWVYQLVTRSPVAKEFKFGSGCFGYGDLAEAGIKVIGGYSSYRNVTSVIVDGEQYNAASSVENTLLQESTFFYDKDETKVYIHFADSDPPNSFGGIRLGIASAYSNQPVVLENIQYEERLSDISPISKKKDPLIFGKLQFTSGSLSLINTDGEFDSVAPEYIFGQRVQVSVVGKDMDIEDAKTIFTGYVENYSCDTEKFTIQFTDTRKKLQKSVPVDHFDLERWPSLNERNVDKVIPLAYGPIRNAQVYCTNEMDIAPLKWIFQVCDTTTHPMTSVSHVYVADTEVAFSNVDTVRGTFELATGVFQKGKKVTCDFVASSITNGIDVLQDLLLQYFDIAYISDNYDIAEWEIARAAAPNIQLFLNKEEPIINTIEKISTSCLGSFLIKSNGKYTFRKNDDDAAPVYIILRDEQLEVPKITYDSSEYATQVVVNYDYNFADNEPTTFLDATRAATIKQLYGTEQSRTFETLLVNRDDAEALATEVMDVIETVPRIYETKIKMQASDFDVADNMVVQSDRVTKDRYGLSLCQTVGITFDLQNAELTLKHRYISDYVQPEPITAGTWTNNYPYIPDNIL